MIIVDRKHVCIKNYETIIHLSDNKVILLIDNNEITIHGEKLIIEYCDEFEVRVHGIIEAIEYENRL